MLSIRVQWCFRFTRWTQFSYMDVFDNLFFQATFLDGICYPYLPQERQKITLFCPFFILTLSLTAPCRRNTLTAYWHMGPWEHSNFLLLRRPRGWQSRKLYGRYLQGSEIGLRKKLLNFKINIAAQPYVQLEKHIHIHEHIQNPHTKIYFLSFLVIVVTWLWSKLLMYNHKKSCYTHSHSRRANLFFFLTA